MEGLSFDDEKIVITLMIMQQQPPSEHFSWPWSIPASSQSVLATTQQGRHDYSHVIDEEL